MHFAIAVGLANSPLAFKGDGARSWGKTKKRTHQVHPPSSSPDLVAASVESVVESGRAVLAAHLVCVKNGLHWLCYWMLIAGSGPRPYARVSMDTRLTKSSSYALLAVVSANSRARLAALRAAFLSS